MKKSTKKIQPEFIVNLTDIKNESEVLPRYAEAKVKAGKPITQEEFDSVKDKVMNDTVEGLTALVSMLPHKEYVVENGAKLILDEFGNAKIKKPNIFKRFWRWIRRK